jgi:integrase
MRLGEVLGLTWNDLNFEKNRISINKQLGRLKDYGTDAQAKTKLSVRKETKTSSSNRVISISSVIMDKLKEHKEKQEFERKRWGKSYQNLNMVFCRADGYYIDPSTFRDFYLKTLENAEIGHKTFHALRHTFATRALEANSPAKVVSNILGHASIQITLDTYSHVSQELQQETMQKMTDIFFKN